MENKTLLKILIVVGIIFTSIVCFAEDGIWVYFNLPADRSVQRDNGILDALTYLTNYARDTIDASIYQMQGKEIAKLFIDAKKRGVRVRLITDYNYRISTQLKYKRTYSAIRSAGIPIIDETFDGGSSSAQCHNKFIVVDKSIVWTGSTNLTDNGLYVNENNVVVIQDDKVAQAYTNEFNEMWGSKDEIPNPRKSRIGSNKIANTLSNFIVGGRKVEVYFTPSSVDIRKHLIEAIRSADKEIYISMFVFSDEELAKAVMDRISKGVKVFGIINNRQALAQYSEYTKLKKYGAVLLKASSSENGLIHNKYCIIDPNYPLSDPTVVTGSLNWSMSAFKKNDENFVVIHDATIAKIYCDEFLSRWKSKIISNTQKEWWRVLK